MLRPGLALILVLGLYGPALAQQPLAISGTIRDTSGGPLPGATVQLIVADTVVATFITLENGQYEVPAPPGVPSRLSVRASGFADELLEIPGLERPATRDIRLQVRRFADATVVTASRAPESQARITQSVTVLSAADIDALGATSLADVIRFAPGVALESSGREGASAAVFSRGGESDYNLVLIDGVRVNQSGGGFDFSRIAAGEIERIEIVRGAQSALYGSDAMGAVVHVFTRRAAATERARVTGSFEAASFGSLRGDAWLSGGARDRIDYAIGWAARRTDGAFADRLPEDDRFEQTAFDASIGALIGPRVSMRTGVRVSDANGRLVGQIGYGILNTGGTADTRDVNWHLNVNHSVAGRFAGTATVNYYRADNVASDSGTDAPVNVYALLSGTPGAIFPGGPRLVRLLSEAEYASLLPMPLPAGQFVASTPFGFGDFPFTSRTQFRRPAFRYTGDLLWGRGYRLTAGYEWERETNALIGEQTLTNHALFVQQQLSAADRWFATVGARVDDKSMYQAFFSPKLSAGGYLLPAQPGAVSSLKVFANFGKGIKSPSFFERFGGSFADPTPGLKVERVRSMDVGAEVTLADQRLRANMALFTSHYRDQIELRSTSPFFAPDGLPDYVNVAGSNAHGIELEGVLQRPYRGVTAAVTYTFVPTEVIETTDLNAQFRPGQPLLRRPKHSGTIRVNYSRGPLDVNWDTRIVGDRHDSSFIGLFTESFDPAEITVNPGYSVSGLGVEYRLPHGITVYVRGDNLFDEAYEGALGYPGNPRSGVIGLRFNVSR